MKATKLFHIFIFYNLLSCNLLWKFPYSEANCSTEQNLNILTPAFPVLSKPVTVDACVLTESICSLFGLPFIFFLTNLLCTSCMALGIHLIISWQRVIGFLLVEESEAKTLSLKCLPVFSILFMVFQCSELFRNVFITQSSAVVKSNTDDYSPKWLYISHYL